MIKELPSTEIKLLDELIGLRGLQIPSYQRPYTWKVRHVLQLLEDLLAGAMKSPASRYRTGTAVLHKDKEGYLNIVDGQQRLTTLSILYFTLEKGGDLPLLSCSYRHEASKINISQNHDAIRLWLSGLSLDDHQRFTKYLVKQCEFVVVTLVSLSEAFQFFDAQNARGKSLQPVDLLKAYHLRAMDTPEQQAQRALCVQRWEAAIDQGVLNWTIGTYIFRIRRWASGKLAQEFSISDIDEFKGVNAGDLPNYPYLRSYSISHQQSQANAVSFPYQFTQLIINGENFFGMIAHYTDMLTALFDKRQTTAFIQFHQLGTCYPGSKRNGDQYVKRMYKAAVLLYYDRFGSASFDQIYPYLYLWCYRLRLLKGSVRYTSIDNYIGIDNLFQRISQSYSPKELLALRNTLMISKGSIERDIAEIKNIYLSYQLLSE
jgi:hypothetical protein